MNEILKDYINIKKDIKEKKKHAKDLKIIIEFPPVLIDWFVTALLLVMSMLFFNFIFYPYVFLEELSTITQKSILYFIITTIVSFFYLLEKSCEAKNIEDLIEESKARKMNKISFFQNVLVIMIFPISLMFNYLVSFIILSRFVFPNIMKMYEIKESNKKLQSLKELIAELEDLEIYKRLKIKKNLSLVKELLEENKGKKNTVVSRRNNSLLELEKKIMDSSLEKEMKRFDWVVFRSNEV